MNLKKRLVWMAVPLALMLTACNRDEPVAPSPTPPAQTQSGSPAPTFSGKVVRVTVAGGKAEVAERTVEVKTGESVRIEVVSDVDDELHVHGYDLKTAVSAGQTSVLELVAQIPGTFEVELEESKLELFRLTVT